MTPSTSSSSHRRYWRYLIPIVLPILLIGALFAVRMAGTSDVATGQSLASAALEERWGIRVVRATVTADGGLIDLRYQVIDPTKALGMLDDLARMPRLIHEASGTEIALNSATHKHNLTVGRTYYILYGNVRGSVRSGDAISIAVGDVKLEHVIVQ